MEDTYFYLPSDKVDRLVELYTKERSRDAWKVSDDNLARTFPVSGARSYFSGGAGLVGTIEDYARFCQMILNKGEFNNHRVLGRKTIELMIRNQIGDATLFESGDKFGLGFRIYTGNGTTLRGQEGTAGSLEWGGMYCTRFIIDPEEDMAILLYTNTQSADGSIFIKCSNLIYSALY
jgi:CubicO group peptidase (beta-lactamase class C family)